MSSRAVVPLVIGGLAGAACGNVESSPDGDAHQVACNGGPVDVLPNGNFDAVDPPWRQDPPNLLCGQPRITPDSGVAAACLGGGGDGSVNEVSRDIFLPAGAVSARLVGRICIATEETEALDNDILTFELRDGTVPISTLGRRTNQQGSAACAFSSFMLEAPLTRDPVTATFRIQSQLDVGKSTSFYVDTLVLTVACR
jgi:hypothetical protein